MKKKVDPTLFATELAQQAGAILMKYFGTELTHNIKTGPDDYATEADLASEKMIIEALEKEFPEDSIIAEESGVHEKAGAKHTWIIDPLDGTFHFANVRKTFQTMIARAEGPDVVLSAIFNPAEDRLIVSQRGKGTTLNGDRLHVDNIPNIATAPLGVNKDLRPKYESGGYVVADPDLTSALIGKRRGRITNKGKVWDHAPAFLAFHEAGFTVTDVFGQPYQWTQEQRGLFAALPDEHATLLAVLQT